MSWWQNSTAFAPAAEKNEWWKSDSFEVAPDALDLPPTEQEQPSEEQDYARRHAEAFNAAVPLNRGVNAAIMGGTASTVAPLIRAVGFSDAADRMHRMSGAMEQVAAEDDKQDFVPAVINRGARGAVSSLIPATIASSVTRSPWGAIAQGAVSQRSQALQEGKDAGLKGTELQTYAGIQGGLEGAIAAVFQKVGLGGVEQALSGLLTKGIAKQGVKKALVQAAKTMTQEQVEEGLTTLAQNANSKYAGVRPDALDPQTLTNDLVDTFVQTAIAAGAVSAPQVIASTWAKENPEAAAKLASKDTPSRKDWKEAGFKERGTPESRKAFADEVRAQQAEPTAQTEQLNLYTEPSATPNAELTPEQVDRLRFLGYDDDAIREASKKDAERVIEKAKNVTRSHKDWMDEVNKNYDQWEAEDAAYTKARNLNPQPREEVIQSDLQQEEGQGRQGLLNGEYADTPRMRQLVAEAAQIESSLPPVAEGHVRLWRGNRKKGDLGKNPQFTNSLPGIALPFKKAYGGPLSYVDVPQGDLANYEQNVGAARGAEFVLPPELAIQAKAIAEPVAAPPAPAIEEERTVQGERPPDPSRYSNLQLVKLYNDSGRKATYDATTGKFEVDGAPLPRFRARKVMAERLGLSKKDLPPGWTGEDFDNLKHETHKRLNEEADEWNFAYDGVLGLADKVRQRQYLRNLKKVASKGGDPDQIKGFDLMVDRAINDFPMLTMGREGSPEANVWHNLLQGRKKKPGLDSDEVEREAFTYATHLNEKPQQEELEFDPGDGGFGSLTESPNAVRITPGTLGKFGKNAGSWLRRMFTSRGHLPKLIHDLKLKRDAEIAKEEQEIKFASVELEDALKAETGSVTLSEPGRLQLNAALQGDAAAKAALPLSVQQAMGRMRTHIDALSQRLINLGLLSQPLEVTIDNNKGVYVVRSYAVHDDPKHKDNVPADVRNKAFAFVKGANPTYTDQQVNNLLDDMLFKDNVPIALIRQSMLGSMDRSSLKQRQNIPKVLRDFMGEYKDPNVNYVRSATKLAHLIANQKFLADAKAQGMGTIFFEKDDASRPEGFNAQIAADESSAMAPLNGLMVQPEVKDAFDRVYAKDGLADTLANQMFVWYMRGIVAVKLSKTVLNPQGWSRNFFSNPFIAIANGINPLSPGKNYESFRTALEEIRPELPQVARRFVPTSKKYQDAVLRSKELGVSDESMQSGVLRDTLRDAQLDVPSHVANDPTYQILTKAINTGSAFYGGGDKHWKHLAQQSEVEMYEKAYKKAGITKTQAEMESEAAERVRNTWPTNSMIPEAVRSWRRVPVVGTFPSFLAEMTRNAVERARLTQRELADPVTRSIGARRLVGQMLAYGVIAETVALASRLIVGALDDEDDYLRQFLPSWQESSELVWIGKQAGKVQYVDLSYTNPFAYFSKPVKAMLHSEDWGEGFQKAAGEAGSPYFQEDILTSKVLDVARNKKASSGGEVYPEYGTTTEKATKSAGHIWQALEPGAITTVRKLKDAATGTVGEHGQTRTIPNELLSLASGLKIESKDINQGLMFDAKGYARSLGKTTQMLSRVIGREGTVSAQEIKTSFQSMERARREEFDTMHKKFKAAVGLGVPVEKAYQTLRANGISEDNADNVVNGVYVPYEMTKQLEDKINELPGAEERFEAYREAKEQE